MENIWTQVLSNLEGSINPQSYNTWFTQTKFKSLADRTLTIEVPNNFYREWLENNYREVINRALTEVSGEDFKLKFHVESEIKEEPARGGVATVVNDNPDIPPSILSIQSVLNPKYRFDNFVVGESNRFCHAASHAVAESPAKAYNPLFLYGGVGLGKTHLMQAIGHYVRENYPKLSVLYVSSERFTNAFIASLSHGKINEFQARFRNIDVLLIDDIQFLAGKEQTQAEFFHTFNALYDANKQIVISSDRPPKEIPTLEERLRSRFEWGLIADILPPDLETRIAILRKKADTDSLSIPSEVTEFIAVNIKSNIRELEGSLIRLAAYASLTSREINLELAKEVLGSIFEEHGSRKISMEQIVETVSNYYNVESSDVLGKKRSKSIVLPRQVSMYIARLLLDMSFPDIGRAFGQKDHTSALHSCKRIETEMSSDPNLKRTIQHLIKEIKG